MTRPFAQIPLIVVVSIGLAVLSVAGCGSNVDPPANARHISFALADAGCVPNSTEASAGPVVFDVENAGTSKVSAMEVLDGNTTLGEVEDLSEGTSDSFSLMLERGKYTLSCPGGEDERGTLIVLDESKTKGREEGTEIDQDRDKSTAPVATTPETEAAIDKYREFLNEYTAALVAATKPLVAAVEAGDVEKGQSLYVPARMSYERIEPVAESLDDLDLRIEAQANEVPISEFGGFHKIEQALWTEGATADIVPVAKRLLADVEELQRKAKTIDLQASQVANIANRLLSEILASKITGEEERYSHVDLAGFEANLEGAEAAYRAIEPLMPKTKEERQKDQIDTNFELSYITLSPHSSNGEFALYTELSREDVQELAQRIEFLADDLSKVPALVAEG